MTGSILRPGNGLLPVPVVVHLHDKDKKGVRQLVLGLAAGAQFLADRILHHPVQRNGAFTGFLFARAMQLPASFWS